MTIIYGHMGTHGKKFSHQALGETEGFTTESYRISIMSF